MYTFVAGDECDEAANKSITNFLRAKKKGSVSAHSRSSTITALITYNQPVYNYFIIAHHIQSK